MIGTEFDYLLTGDDGNIQDVREINYIDLPDKLYDIFALEGIDEYRTNFGTYTYNGIAIPRVSNIIKSCVDQEPLIRWVGHVGYKANTIRETALKVGNVVHELVEHFLLTGEDDESKFKFIGPALERAIKTSYNNFKNWKINLENNGYKIEAIIAIEHPIKCPYYGGTIDCIMRINGKNYIVDFKTSKSIIHEYIIQTSAYMWAVNNGYAPELPHIDGIGIIRIDKSYNVYEDLFLNEHIPYQREIIEKFYTGFGYMLQNYYHNINMQYLFEANKKQCTYKEINNAIYV